jgi:DNA-binding transcriptional LysR family regulator
MTTLRYLKTFIAVVRYGNFAAAGERIGLTAAAISIQMRRLEETLDVTLFDRRGRAVMLTDQAWRMVAHAEKIIAMTAQIEQGVDDHQVMGCLRIGAIQTELLGIVVPALARFRERFPSVEVHFTPGTSADLLALLEQQRIDCAMIVKPTYDISGALQWQLLRREPYVLIVPLSMTDLPVHEVLKQHPFIRYDKRAHGGALVDQFLKRNGIMVRDAIEIDGIESIGMMVAAGLGVAIVPSTRVFDACHIQVRQLSLGDDIFYRELGLVTRADCRVVHLIHAWKAALCSHEHIPAT